MIERDYQLEGWSYMQPAVVPPGLIFCQSAVLQVGILRKANSKKHLVFLICIRLENEKSDIQNQNLH